MENIELNLDDGIGVLLWSHLSVEDHNSLFEHQWQQHLAAALSGCNTNLNLVSKSGLVVSAHQMVLLPLSSHLTSLVDTSECCECPGSVPTLVLPDWDHTVIQVLVQFLYTGSVIVDGDMMGELMVLMSQFRLQIPRDSLLMEQIHQSQDNQMEQVLQSPEISSNHSPSDQSSDEEAATKENNLPPSPGTKITHGRLLTLINDIKTQIGDLSNCVTEDEEDYNLSLDDCITDQQQIPEYCSDSHKVENLNDSNLKSKISQSQIQLRNIASNLEGNFNTADPSESNLKAGDLDAGFPNESSLKAKDSNESNSKAGDPNETSLKAKDPNEGSPKAGDPDYPNETSLKAKDPNESCPKAGDSDYCCPKVVDLKESISKAGDSDADYPNESSFKAKDSNESSTKPGESVDDYSKVVDPNESISKAGYPNESSLKTKDPIESNIKPGGSGDCYPKVGDPKEIVLKDGYNCHICDIELGKIKANVYHHYAIDHFAENLLTDYNELVDGQACLLCGEILPKNIRRYWFLVHMGVKHRGLKIYLPPHEYIGITKNMTVGGLDVNENEQDTISSTEEYENNWKEMAVCLICDLDLCPFNLMKRSHHFYEHFKGQINLWLEGMQEIYTHDPKVCPQCKAKFMAKKSLGKHMGSVHNLYQMFIKRFNNGQVAKMKPDQQKLIEEKTSPYSPTVDCKFQDKSKSIIKSKSDLDDNIPNPSKRRKMCQTSPVKTFEAI